jgi:hypothetical protein
MRLRPSDDPTRRHRRAATLPRLETRPHPGSRGGHRDWLASYRQGRPLRRAIAETAMTVLVLFVLTALLLWLQGAGGR